MRKCVIHNIEVGSYISLSIICLLYYVLTTKDFVYLIGYRTMPSLKYDIASIIYLYCIPVIMICKKIIFC